MLESSTTLFPPHDLTRIASDALKSWSRCKRQFAYKYVTRLQWPSDARHFSLGQNVHKLLDYHARGLDCEPLVREATPDVQNSWRKLIAHRTVQWPVIANEWAFHVPITLKNGTVEWLTGRMDRVAREPLATTSLTPATFGTETADSEAHTRNHPTEKDKIWIIDWKTGTGVPRNAPEDWQTRLYLFALLEVANTPSAADLGLSRQGLLQAEDIGFLYVEVKPDTQTPIREVPIPYSRERHEETRRLLEQNLNAMSVEEQYALPSQCPDRYCVYRSICGIDEQGQ